MLAVISSIAPVHTVVPAELGAILSVELLANRNGGSPKNRLLVARVLVQLREGHGDLSFRVSSSSCRELVGGFVLDFVDTGTPRRLILRFERWEGMRRTGGGLGRAAGELWEL